MLVHGQLCNSILGAFFDAYNGVGFGFSERICVNALCVELSRRQLRFAREVPFEVVHLGVVLGLVRLDLVVEESVVVETKTVKAVDEGEIRQILSYLKASPYEVGLLLNFGPSPEHRRYIYTNDRKGLRSNS